MKGAEEGSEGMTTGALTLKPEMEGVETLEGLSIEVRTGAVIITERGQVDLTSTRPQSLAQITEAQTSEAHLLHYPVKPLTSDRPIFQYRAQTSGHQTGARPDIDRQTTQDCQEMAFQVCLEMEIFRVYQETTTA